LIASLDESILGLRQAPAAALELRRALAG